MKTVHQLGRFLLPLGLLALAACQTVPVGQSQQQGAAAPAPQGATEQSKPAETVQATRQGAPVAVFLADTENHAGWRAVQIQAGTIYLNPQPIITRDDLDDVRAGTSAQGEGLLALGLTELGKKKVEDITGANPNMRLALVVGRTMMAAPGYTTAVSTDQLVFGVGTEANATAAARAIAGVPPEPATSGASTATPGN
ncbi:SecDF P1 head subdomain-containing protein [Pusillimonas minor]|uniref:SecDF P1 head subdomain domain-containing protein n=1 Tax=Pusillimonas minor TaxID=2697024 RepID=A0A842HSC8_9BURK|nr:hypothetical protein [Pusillimonas minor]MBC2771153.1 hypothetical protein [Pusillimonas minor]